MPESVSRENGSNTQEFSGGPEKSAVELEGCPLSDAEIADTVAGLETFGWGRMAARKRVARAWSRLRASTSPASSDQEPAVSVERLLAVAIGL